MEWNRTSYDTTVISCAGDDMPGDVWYRRIASLIGRAGSIAEFRIHDNRYHEFPGVLVTEGVKGNMGRPSASGRIVRENSC
jgi:hypothetical protein